MKHRSIHLACLSMLMGIAGSACAAASAIYVTTNGTGNGTDWGDPTSLTNALVICQDGDEIWVTEGTYIPEAGTNYDITTNNVTIYGGFTNGMSAVDERNWTNYPSILDGTNGEQRVLNIAAAGLTLDGLTIQRGGGDTNANSRFSIDGGGIYKPSGGGTLTLRHCTFWYNGYLMRSKKGSCLYALNTDVIVDDCLFVSNHMAGAYVAGAGFYIEGGSISVTDSSFIGNDGHYSSLGGAGQIKNATGAFTNCLFQGNKCSAGASKGGALYIDAGASRTVTVVNCTIVGGSVVGANGGNGGAIYVESGNMAVRNSIFWGNAAEDDADEIYNNAGSDAITMEYSCIPGMGAPYVRGIITSSNVITNDPLFATNDYTDMHLKSTGGRWHPASQAWTNDTVDSPCRDAGDPTSGYSDEPANNGSRINMGAYGNTTQASKYPTGVLPIATNLAPTVYTVAATLNGRLVGGTPAEITIWYGTNQASLESWSRIPFYQTNGATFSVNVGGLTPNTQYWCTCVASNSAGTNTASPYTNFWTGTPVSAGPDIIHVDVNSPSPEPTGKNWDEAFTTVGSAVAAAEGTTNTLWVAQGTYMEVDATIATAGTAVYGGFTNGMTNFSLRDPTNYPVILDANYAFDRVMSVTAPGVVLDGLTLQRSGQLSGVFAKSGGGIYKPSGGGTLKIHNCVFRNNGLCMRSQSGGAIYATGTDVVITDSSFISNQTQQAYTPGGAIMIENGSLTVSNTPFAYNAVKYAAGGAVYIGSSSSARFMNCTFWSNSATTVASSKGGTIAIVPGSSSYTTTIENCTIAGSFSTDVGGALYLASGKLVIENAILWGNSAGGDGDEIYNGVGAGAVTMAYSCIPGTGEPYTYSIIAVSNIITNDPLFATNDYTDLHLKSVTGRWDAVAGVWTNDAVHSPCIDAGAGTSDYSQEPADNGGRINMGAYGNTAKASKSPEAVSPVATNLVPSVAIVSATLYGQLVAGTQSDITFWYGTNQASLDLSSHLPSYQSTGVVFSATVGGLAPNTQYWCTCVASNPAGTNTAAPYTNFWTSTPVSAGADIIHVDLTSPNPVETGQNWAEAYKTVTAAAAAAAGTTNTLWIAQGTYVEQDIAVATAGTAIYGGFTNGMTNFGTRNVTNYPAILDADYQYDRVMSITAAGVLLDGLTIQRGGLTSGHFYDSGGGIYKSAGGGTLSIHNCVLRHNGLRMRQGEGGALYATGTDVIITDSSFISNQTQNAYTEGGAIYATGGSLSVTNCIFDSSNTRYAMGGGCVYLASACESRFVNCVFKSNTVDQTADGGVFIVDVGASTTVTVENCTFAGNVTTKKGGAFYLKTGKLIIKDSILWGNSATDGNDICNESGNGNAVITYSCLQGTNATYLDGLTVTTSGVITNNPLFATEYTDLHLKSQYGRWNPATAAWTRDDDLLSPCINAGDPATAFGLEPFENGGRVNMGAYGNTRYASKSKPIAGTMFIFE